MFKLGNKQIVILAAAAVIIVGAVSFQKYFFRSSLPITPIEKAEERPPEELVLHAEAPLEEPPEISKGVSEGDSNPVGSPPAIPNFVGRDPAEVRPMPDEVRLFSEQQKRDIYRDLENNGQAVKQNPNFFFGWIQVGLLKKVIGDYEGARDAWEYAGLIEPGNSLSFGNLGELYWRYLPDFPRSEANFKISLKNTPADIQSYISLSDLYYYSYKTKEELADDILLEGIAANPDSADLLKRLAYLYERRGEYASAIEWWGKVLAKDSGNTEVAAAIEALKKKQ